MLSSVPNPSSIGAEFLTGFAARDEESLVSGDWFEPLRSAHAGRNLLKDNTVSVLRRL
jgi:hypothetical protein